MNYNEPDNKTTQIPSFLRGAEYTGLPPEEDTQELEAPKEKAIPVEEVQKIEPAKQEIPPEKKPSKKKKPKKNKLPLSVRRLSVVVVIAFVLYVGINVFWVLSGSSSVPEKEPEHQNEVAEVEENNIPTAAPTVLPEVTEAPIVPSNIGTASVLAETITKRTEPSLGAPESGTAMMGETYNVSNVQDADGYTWYQIDDGTWIASDGTWIEFVQN